MSVAPSMSVGPPADTCANLERAPQTKNYGLIFDTRPVFSRCTLSGRAYTADTEVWMHPHREIFAHNFVFPLVIQPKSATDLNNTAARIPTSGNVPQLALAHARFLDALYDAEHSQQQHDALLAVGDLLGGRSAHGFHHDVKLMLDGKGDAGKADRVWLAGYWLLDAEHIMQSGRQAEQIEDIALPA